MMKNLKPILNIIVVLAFQALSVTTTMAQRTLPSQYVTGTKANHIRIWDAVKPLSDSTLLNLSAAVSASRITTNYFDGLGRPLQTVIKKGSLATSSVDPVSSANAADLVSGAVYDEFGRERFKYLPAPASNTGGNSSVNDGLFKLNPFQQQEAFYNSHLSGQSGEVSSNKNWAYSQVNFENSPLNRASEQFAPGVSWVGTQGQSDPANRHSVKNNYWNNTTLDSVRIWNITDAAIGSFGTYSTSGMYAAGLLTKSSMTDENGSQVIEFKDKAGQLILKKVQHTAISDNGVGKGHHGWLCTYYLYDNLNRLRAVLQPEGVKILSGTSWALTATLLNEQCFRYEYDEKGRLINKKVPGAGEVYMVYDSRDRMAMSQDANLRLSGKWMVTLFDEINRSVQTGLLLNTVTLYGTANRTFAQHRATADTSSNYPFAVASPPSSTYWEWLTKTGYDNYTGLPAGLSSTLLTTWNTHFSATDNNNFPFPQMPVQTAAVKGLPTWSQVKVLGTASQYLGAVSIYDDKGRVIQVQSQNITGGVDVVTTQFSWAGQPLIIVAKQEKAAPLAQTTVVVTRFTYDELLRMVKLEKKISNTNIKVGGTLGAMSAYKTTVLQEYDALGQVKKKVVAPSGSIDGTPLETLDHEYNIRGWALGVNRAFVNDAVTRKFGFELGYDKASAIIAGESYAIQQYNSNIGGTIWKSFGDQEKRKYDFSYDNVNRITGAEFKQYNNGGFNLSSQIDYSLKNLTYDANGNVLTLNQRGWKFGGSETIDSLLYTYFENSNRLRNVIDRKNDTSTNLGDFRSSGIYMRALAHNKTTTATDYYYDPNGNLVRDLNKEVGSTSVNGITYNHLNLPSSIQVKNSAGGERGTISYVYDATGIQLKKTVQETGKPDNVTLYIGGVVYVNDTLFFLDHEEGRIRNVKRYFTNGDSSFNLIYDYFLKDQVGNVRMILTEQQDTGKYIATMEAAYRLKEEALFSKINNTVTGLPTGYPLDGSTTNPNDFVSVLNGSGNKIGPGIVLKVMSGDSVSIGVKSFFKTNASPGSTSSAVNDILLSLALGITGKAGELKGTVSQIASPTGALAGIVTLFRNDHTEERPAKPRAYLNWILFDEQLKYVPDNSNADAVKNENSLDVLNGRLKLSKNGYLCIYLSNETQNWDVFFNDLSIHHFTGPLIEETHYYPFGSVMAGISSQSHFIIPNKEKTFQEQRKEASLDVNLIRFRYRSHDPQIGRFIQVDPLSDDYRYQSPYNFSENRVIDGRELEGLEYISVHHYANGRVEKVMYYKSSDAAINKVNGTTSGWYNSASFGPLGKGVIHYYYNADGTLNGEPKWDNKRFDVASNAGNHGLYSGPGSVTKDGGGTNYDFSHQPIDWADAIAKRHDMDYAQATSSGEPYVNYVDDIRTVQADRDMVARVNDVLGDLKSGGALGAQGVETPFRTTTSQEMRNALVGQKIVISALAIYKQWKIDNKFTNNDRYGDLRERFKESSRFNEFVTKIIDQIVNQ